MFVVRLISCVLKRSETGASAYITNFIWEGWLPLIMQVFDCTKEGNKEYFRLRPKLNEHEVPYARSVGERFILVDIFIQSKSSFSV